LRSHDSIAKKPLEALQAAGLFLRITQGVVALSGRAFPWAVAVLALRAIATDALTKLYHEKKLGE